MDQKLQLSHSLTLIEVPTSKGAGRWRSAVLQTRACAGND